MQSGWWQGALGVVVGAAIPICWSLFSRWKERGGEIRAMHAEFHLAHIYLRAYLGDGVAAPLYRIPVSMTKQALPKMVGDGLLSLDDVGAFVEYVNVVDEINRGLDLAADAVANNRGAAIFNEQNRLTLKIDRMLNQGMERRDNLPIFDAAHQSLFRVKGAFAEPVWTSLFGRWPDGD
jgi:hypothetical protein